MINEIISLIKKEKSIKEKIRILERNINSSLIERIERREIKLGIPIKILKEKFGINIFSYQKTRKLNDGKIKDGYEFFLEEKIKGKRLFITVDYDQSISIRDKRNSLIKNDKLKEEILNSLNRNNGSFIFDGIYTVSNIYYIFDIIPLVDFQNGYCRIPLYNRKKIIQSIIKYGDKIKMSPYKLLEYKEILENKSNLSGNIIKERLSHYDCYNNSNNWYLI